MTHSEHLELSIARHNDGYYWSLYGTDIEIIDNGPFATKWQAKRDFITWVKAGETQQQ